MIAMAVARAALVAESVKTAPQQNAGSAFSEAVARACPSVRLRGAPNGKAEAVSAPHEAEPDEADENACALAAAGQFFARVPAPNAPQFEAGLSRTCANQGTGVRESAVAALSFSDRETAHIPAAGEKPGFHEAAFAPTAKADSDVEKTANTSAMRLGSDALKMEQVDSDALGARSASAARMDSDARATVDASNARIGSDAPKTEYADSDARELADASTVQMGSGTQEKARASATRAYSDAQGFADTSAARMGSDARAMANASNTRISSEAPKVEHVRELADAPGVRLDSDAPNTEQADSDARDVAHARLGEPKEAFAPVHLNGDVRDAARAQQASRTDAPHAAREPSASAQLARSSVRALAQGKSTFHLRLRPEGLGEVAVTIRAQERELSLSIRASSGATRELILGQIDDLRGALAAAEYQLGGLSVEVNASGQGGAAFSTFSQGHEIREASGPIQEKPPRAPDATSEQSIRARKGAIMYRI